MAKYLAESMFSPLISFDVLNLEVFSRETQAVVQIICVVRLDRTLVGDGWRRKNCRFSSPPTAAHVRRLDLFLFDDESMMTTTPTQVVHVQRWWWMHGWIGRREMRIYMEITRTWRRPSALLISSAIERTGRRQISYLFLHMVCFPR